MARINLLPWREERRKLRQKEFVVMFAMAALGAVLLSFVIISYYNSQIDGQNERNTYLRDQIAQVDKAIKEIEELDKKKSKLLARKDVIEQLQANRSQMVHLFDSLVRTIPDGAVLTSIKQDSQTLTLEGRAQSNARVSTYMRHLEGSGWISKPDLSIIEAKGNDKGLPYEFKLQVQLANPNAPLDEDGDGLPDEPAASASEIAQSASAGVSGTASAGTASVTPTPGAAHAQPASAPVSTPVAAPVATPAANTPTAPAAAPTKGAAS